MIDSGSLRRALFLVALVSSGLSLRADHTHHAFDRVLLSEEFTSEGACFADIDGDGANDIVSGPYWYAGSAFTTRHEYAPGKRFAVKGYSEHFFSFAHDFNDDGRPDILVIPTPGLAAHWFENPGRAGVHWARHLALASVDGESPELADITGDGHPELVCAHGGAFGYAEPDRSMPTNPWTFVPVTDRRGFQRFTHGLGVGDVNGDGRMDLLETNGWWEQTPVKGELFRFHAVRLAESGGAQMFAYDFDGDGDNDILSTQNAHARGIAWFEQTREGETIRFIRHDILGAKATDNAHGLTISQMHAVAIADIDGDGVQDFVTGKRYFAHGGNDPGAHELAVLYWFRTVRTTDDSGTTRVHFEPWLIDRRSGVGTQLVVGDVSGNGLPDVVVGNKLGTFVMLHSARSVSSVEYEALRPRERDTAAHVAGTDLFASHVRSTAPLSPVEELETFVVPPGFEVQLVAAEPEIAKPMNLAVDARGRLWVSSSEEYPWAAPPDRRARDTIKVLEDVDGDGRADIITTFADGLNIPIGLVPHRDGVICFSIPDVLFLRDTDGDGRADAREKLYGPMGHERDTHGMCNAFRAGLDGWIYACHGFNNETRVSGRDGHEVLMQSGNTFRMRPDGSRIEHFTHGQVNPFGMTFDRYGDAFTADCHSKPISLLIPGGHFESFGKPHDGLGFVPRVMEHSHGSTAICGIALGEALSFPGVYGDSVFGGNVTTCRINRNTLERHGSSIRAREEPDFLVSDDPWFRPVDLVPGADGSLYIADFYNRIIGHYEVPLTHPGRDRKRGRIWRVVPTRGSDRRDRQPRRREPTDLTAASFSQLVSELDAPAPGRAWQVVDTLVERFGADAAAAARSILRGNGPALSRARALWTVERAGALEGEDLATAMAAESALLRVHAFRVMAARPAVADVAWLTRGLADPEPLVRRAAATASRSHPARELVRPLLDLVHGTASGDPHLRHAVRMALRDHLRNETWFRQLVDSALSDPDREVLAGLCLALGGSAAGEFLLDAIDLVKDRGELVRALEFAARHVSARSVTRVVELARGRFGDDVDFQLELLASIRGGLLARDRPGSSAMLPASVRRWAVSLADPLLAANATSRPLEWRFVPHPGTPDRGDPWVLSTRRRSADGLPRTPLHSSFPRGEQWTGIYRSEPFAVGETFSFWIAGHDGYPERGPQGKNRVRLRDATSHEVLHECGPPRNDTAQRVSWTTRPGTRVYVELVDGDTAGAYAWLAVGRFSDPRLDPSAVSETRSRAAALIRDFRLGELRPGVEGLLRAGTLSRSNAEKLASALVSLTPDARLAALALVPSIAAAPERLIERAMAAIVSRDSTDAAKLLAEGLRVASAAEQSRIAERLAADRHGAAMLTDLAESGRVGPRLLAAPRVAQILEASLDDADRERLEQLTADLPEVDGGLQGLIASRKKSFLEGGGSAAVGAALFEKSCSPCHRVGERGADFAPNLDGIGNRGLDRLVEDILAPNQNVDIAFRSTTVVTKRGKVLAGLLRPDSGSGILLVDSEGKTITIPAADVRQRIETRLSPMPANLGTTLSARELGDLLAYLLSLR